MERLDADRFDHLHDEAASSLLLEVESIPTSQTRIEAAAKDGGIARGMGN